jgi:lipoyl(octanoyl) transferase
MGMGVWRWLGRVPFAETVRQQELARAHVLQGDGPETLLLCEHHPVVTMGRSANRANVLASPADLARRGVDLHAASRGGDVTYHGPGQLVGYPIVRLRTGVVEHVTAMARAIASVLRELAIDARWRRETPGLWVDDNTGRASGGRERGGGGRERGGGKICAFGVHVHRRVTMHGFALNVADALDGFDLIVPCGLQASRTTSIAAALPEGRSIPPMHVLASRVAAALGRELGTTFEPAIESPSRVAHIENVEMSVRITRMIQA